MAFGRIKTNDEIQAMRDGGKILATIFDGLKKRIASGVSERELDAWVANEIKALGAEATYRTAEVNFPGSVCISVNQQITHSVPSDYRLQRGDLVGFDLVVTYKGMKTDSAITVIVDDAAPARHKKLVAMTERSLYAGIDAIKGPVRIGDISHAIEQILLGANLGIVRDLVGHGIGHSMHQPPDVPNYGQAGTGFLLDVGDTIAIEPMATLGSEDIITEADGWGLSTADGSLAAQFEHTVLITEKGAEILTQL